MATWAIAQGLSRNPITEWESLSLHKVTHFSSPSCQVGVITGPILESQTLRLTEALSHADPSNSGAGQVLFL